MREPVHALELCKRILLTPIISLLGEQAARRTTRSAYLWRDLGPEGGLLPPSDGAPSPSFRELAERQGKLLAELPDGSQLLRNAYLRAMEGTRRGSLHQALERWGWTLEPREVGGVLLHRVVPEGPDAVSRLKLEDEAFRPLFLWAFAQSYARFMLGTGFEPQATCYHPPFRAAGQAAPDHVFPSGGLPVEESDREGWTAYQGTGLDGGTWHFERRRSLSHPLPAAGAIETLLAGLRLRHLDVEGLSPGELAEFAALQLNLRATLISELRHRLAWVYCRRGVAGRDIIGLLCPRAESGSDEGWRLVQADGEKRLVPRSFPAARGKPGEEEQLGRAKNVMQRHRNSVRREVDAALSGLGQDEEVGQLTRPPAEVPEGLFRQHRWVNQASAPFGPPIMPPEGLKPASVDELDAVLGLFEQVADLDIGLPTPSGWMARLPRAHQEAAKRMVWLAESLGHPTPDDAARVAWDDDGGQAASTSRRPVAEFRLWWTLASSWPASGAGLFETLRSAVPDPSRRIALLLRLVELEKKKYPSLDDIGKYVLRSLVGLDDELWATGLPPTLVRFLLGRVGAAWRMREGVVVDRGLREALEEALLQGGDRRQAVTGAIREHVRQLRREARDAEPEAAICAGTLDERATRLATGLMLMHLLVRVAWLHRGDPAEAEEIVDRVLPGDADPADPSTAHAARRAITSELAGRRRGRPIRSGDRLDRLWMLFASQDRVHRILEATDRALLREYAPARLLAGIRLPEAVVTALYEHVRDRLLAGKRERVRQGFLAELGKRQPAEWSAAYGLRGRLPGFDLFLGKARQDELGRVISRVSPVLVLGHLMAPDQLPLVLTRILGQPGVDPLEVVRSVVLDPRNTRVDPGLGPAWTLIDRERLFETVAAALEDTKMTSVSQQTARTAPERSDVEPANKAEDTVWATRLELLTGIRTARSGQGLGSPGHLGQAPAARLAPDSVPAGPLARACALGPDLPAETSSEARQAAEPEKPEALERVRRSLARAWRLPADWLMVPVKTLDLAGAWGTLDEGDLRPGDPLTLELPWHPDEGQHHLVIVHRHLDTEEVQLPLSEDDWAYRLEDYRYGGTVRIPVVAQGPAGLHSYVVATPPPDWPVVFGDDDSNPWDRLQRAVERGEVRAGTITVRVETA